MINDLLTKEEYKDYCDRFSRVWLYLRVVSHLDDAVIHKVCDLRGYAIEGKMPDMLSSIGFVFVDKDKLNLDVLKKLDNGDLGLFTKEGNFLLQDRFIFPVKDMIGNVIALIGWYPDEKKYITTPSRFFKKQNILFGMEQLKTTGLGKKYFLVEGIFDCISIRSLGFNCMAMMGISANAYTQVLYSLFSKLVAIPDNDTEGRKVIVRDGWKLPSNGSYVKLSGKFKDIDDMLKYYDMSDTLTDILTESGVDRVIEIVY